MILWKFQISNIVTTQEVYVPQKGYKKKGAGGQINLKYLKTRVFWGFLEKYPKIKIFRKTPKKKGSRAKNQKSTSNISLQTFLEKNPKMEIFQEKTLKNRGRGAKI